MRWQVCSSSRNGPASLRTKSGNRSRRRCARRRCGRCRPLPGRRGRRSLPPNKRSKKPPCWPASAAERYCAPQPLSPSAISSDWRCAARSVVPPLSCSSWFCRRSSALRCWSIWRLRGPHCGGGLLKIEKKPELSQPMRRDCATSRSTSNCWRLTASSARRIWSARAGRHCRGRGRELGFQPLAVRVGRLRDSAGRAAIPARDAAASCRMITSCWHSNR